MTTLRVFRAGLLSAMLAGTQFAAGATQPHPAATSKPVQKASFIPASFQAPIEVKTAFFKLVPLSPAVVKVDFDAYMSSIEHLQTTFTRSTDWPRKDITAADAIKDMDSEWGRFQRRESFAYAVLTPDGRRELGSVYISPCPVPGYDAVVRMWVTKADFDAGFDAKLYAWVTDWLRKDWPFKKVAYPGRAIDWKIWDPLVAASTPAKK